MVDINLTESILLLPPLPPLPPSPSLSRPFLAMARIDVMKVRDSAARKEATMGLGKRMEVRYVHYSPSRNIDGANICHFT